MSEHPFLKGDIVKLAIHHGIGSEKDFRAGIYAKVISESPFRVTWINIPDLGWDYAPSLFTLAGSSESSCITAQDTDNVNSPQHYNHNHKGIECIDAMEAMLTPDEFIGYLRGNIFKYLWRFPYKNGLEDVKKSQWYLNKLVTKLENK